jgi:phytoene dehydrogenase-like protein
MDHFDVAVIGAGPEGLVAAIVLARTGLRVVLLEKASAPGGCATTHEFHPGFRASLYADELPAIPNRLYRILDLARHGAILVPPPASVCISQTGTSVLFADETRLAHCVPAAALPGIVSFRRELDALRQAIEARTTLPPCPQRRRWFCRTPKFAHGPPWPARGWGAESLDEMLLRHVADPQLRLHLVADAVSGRAVSPFLAGTSLHALAPGVGRSGTPCGGLGRLASALARAAEAAGVVQRCGAQVSAIHVERGRVTLLSVAGQGSITAAAVISALNVKQTFLGLMRWEEMPSSLAGRIGRFRMTGQRARVLFALDRVPKLPASSEIEDVFGGPIHVVSSMQAFAAARGMWRAGVVPGNPLVTLRIPSSADPRFAPIAKAMMTATLSSIPTRLSEGEWTEDKRLKLVAIALTAAKRVYPDIEEFVLAHHVVTGSDMETALGATGGDLEGGELAPDQALGFRPFHEANWQDGRTPVRGLYLGSSSSSASPFLLGVSGERAALAVSADFATGYLR